MKNENIEKSTDIQQKKIGKIVNSFGLKGELKILPNSANDFENLDMFYISGFDQEFKVEKSIIKDNRFVKLKIFGYDDINDIEKFKGHDIIIASKKEKQLGVDEYLTENLIGCNLIYNNKVVGQITEVENFGASDIFVFIENKEEKRVPFVDEFIDKIDIKNKKIFVTENFYDGVI